MSSYAAKQNERDAAYRRDYEQWVASLSPSERQQLEALGVDAPAVPGAGNGGANRDAAESSRAQCEDEFHDPFDAVHPDEPFVAPILPGNERVVEQSAATQVTDADHLHDLLRRLVGELLGQDNARLSLECLALVTGLAYCGDSMTEIGKRHGVSRAAVSKRCVELTQALNLNPSRAMRSLKARESYRTARIKRIRQHL